MPSIIVFDPPETTTLLQMDVEDTTAGSGSSTPSAVSFDDPAANQVLEPAGDPTGFLQLDPVQTDVWIGDPTPATVVIEGEQRPDYAVVDENGTDLVVVSPAGPRGGIGPVGPPGPVGTLNDLPDLTLIFENGLI